MRLNRMNFKPRDAPQTHSRKRPVYTVLTISKERTINWTMSAARRLIAPCGLITLKTVEVSGSRCERSLSISNNILAPLVLKTVASAFAVVDLRISVVFSVSETRNWFLRVWRFSYGNWLMVRMQQFVRLCIWKMLGYFLDMMWFYFNVRVFWNVFFYMQFCFNVNFNDFGMGFFSILKYNMNRLIKWLINSQIWSSTFLCIIMNNVWIMSVMHLKCTFNWN